MFLDFNSLSCFQCGHTFLIHFFSFLVLFYVAILHARLSMYDSHRRKRGFAREHRGDYLRTLGSASARATSGGKGKRKRECFRRISNKIPLPWGNTCCWEERVFKDVLLVTTGKISFIGRCECLRRKRHEMARRARNITEADGSSFLSFGRNSSTNSNGDSLFSFYETRELFLQQLFRVVWDPVKMAINKSVLD